MIQSVASFQIYKKTMLQSQNIAGGTIHQNIIDPMLNLLKLWTTIRILLPVIPLLETLLSGYLTAVLQFRP